MYNKIEKYTLKFSFKLDIIKKLLLADGCLDYINREK